ncbi:MAG: Fur family transcriptional regulator [Alphaproteobacteria bacterium]
MNKLSWEKSLTSLILPSELLHIWGGASYQSMVKKRNRVIAALKEKKLANEQNSTLQKKSEVALYGMLKSANITPTHTRLLVMQILFQQKAYQHITAEDIFKKIRDRQATKLMKKKPYKNKNMKKLKQKKMKSISLASIYNSLNLLVEKGLLARHDFRYVFLDNKKYQSIFYDTNIIPHHHVIDKASKKIYDLSLDIFDIENLTNHITHNVKKQNMIAKNLWRMHGMKRKIFIAPLIFILE